MKTYNSFSELVAANTQNELQTTMSSFNAYSSTTNEPELRGYPRDADKTAAQEAAKIMTGIEFEQLDRNEQWNLIKKVAKETKTKEEFDKLIAENKFKYDQLRAIYLTAKDQWKMMGENMDAISCVDGFDEEGTETS